MTSRREFLWSAGAATALWGTMAGPDPLEALPPGPAEEWDLSWVRQVTGKHRAVFDAIEIERGTGILRASIWAAQVRDVLKAKADQVSPVLVIRHNAIVLAMSNAFWARYGVARRHDLVHPATGAPLEQNPALLDESHGMPPAMAEHGLARQIARGVPVLACNLALRQIGAIIMEQDKVPEPEAARLAREAMVPGVILQPSGVFAAILAQEHGCAYIKAS